jgi:mono/diheme cytochrome c family protein
MVYSGAWALRTSSGKGNRHDPMKPLSHIRGAWLLPVLVLIALAAAACSPGDPGRSTGAYKVDIFQEMHYNQTLKAQEPPRFLPPGNSVPITGGKLPLPELRADAAALANPVSAGAVTLNRAALLYNINCSTCHGAVADGQGPVGIKFIEYGASRPPAFDSERVRELASGSAYFSITRGFGLMPAFGNLLSDEDRWTLVNLIALPNDQRVNLLSRPENQPSGG